MVNKRIFWNSKNVMVTGHTGFKGSWLSLWLTRLGANVSELSLPGRVSNPDLFEELQIENSIYSFRGNIIDLKTCKKIINKCEPEILFHLAAQPIVRRSYNDPLETFHSNIIGTANILEAARELNSLKTIIVVTSDKCYENIEDKYAYKEGDPLGGFDPYSSSKACAELVSSAYYRSFFESKKIGLATVRAGNVIGGGDWSSDRLIPDAVRSWVHNEELLIRYPNATRPWQHVLDPLNGYIKLAEKLWFRPNRFSGPWNFGPENKSVKPVKTILEIAEKEWNISTGWKQEKGNYPHEAGMLELDSNKSRSKLNWQPKINFEASIINTIKWYKEYYTNKKNIKNYTINQITNFENNYE